MKNQDVTKTTHIALNIPILVFKLIQSLQDDYAYILLLSRISVEIVLNPEQACGRTFTG